MFGLIRRLTRTVEGVVEGCYDVSQPLSNACLGPDMRRLLGMTMLALAPTLVAADAAAQGSPRAEAADGYDASLQVALDKIDALRALGTTLRKDSEEPVPPKLTADQIAEVKKYDAWLGAASGRVLKLATSWSQKLDQLRVACEKDPSCDRVATAKAFGDTNLSFNLQCLRLQNEMQNEHRTFTAVSNIMKTKHDTVTNSISNVR